jgi:glycosyltransferase involved in cell wall biosynthesis
MTEAFAAQPLLSVVVPVFNEERNCGVEIGMTAGLDYARGRYTAIMHAALQDPPELIPEMLALGIRSGARTSASTRFTLGHK